MNSRLLIPVLRSRLISKLAANANTFQSTLFVLTLEVNICSGFPFFYSLPERILLLIFQPIKNDWFEKWSDFSMKEELNELFRIL